MTKDTLPFRAEHIGSLLRPPELLKLRSEGDQYRTVRGSLAKPECPSSNASGQSEQCWNGGSGSFWGLEFKRPSSGVAIVAA
jgi:hypothetical protein